MADVGVYLKQHKCLTRCRNKMWSHGIQSLYDILKMGTVTRCWSYLVGCKDNAWSLIRLLSVVFLVHVSVP
jgi:hypothetical protein